MSRYDSVGMFWEDTKGSGILPTYNTDWTPPSFPNLSGVKVLGLDTETYDPAMKDAGPGWARGDGNIVGVSISTGDASWYFPIKHTVQKELNMDPVQVKNFLNDVLGTHIPKVGANLQYDIGWLEHEGIYVSGDLYDIQFAEALIDDTAKSYSLDSLANKYIGESKVTKDLYNWSHKAYGGGKDQRANIYRCPPSLVGPYAEADAHLPIQILKLQWKKLQELGLVNLFKMECDLIRVLIGMRFRGMNIDHDRAEIAEKAINDKISELRSELKRHAGFEVSVNSNSDLVRMFDKHGQPYPRTEKGNPSFVKDWLNTNEYVGAQLVSGIRKYEKAIGTFIRGAILDKQIDGKVFPSFHPLRGEWGGAVSGRFSSSKPNAQQIPSRDDELAPLIRGIFVPDEGCQWCKIDYSQIEYRFFAHFSQAEWLIEAYMDPTADFHDVVREMIGFTGHRTPVKSINFGLLYGMGKDKLIQTLSTMGLNISGEEFLKIYHDKFPEARKLLHECSDTAQRTGEIRTILNRRNTFNLFEPAHEWSTPLPYYQAIKRYGVNIKRSMTHKALNRKLQGSAADLMKKAMVLAHKEGIFDRIGYPHVTVHDELDLSYHPDMKEDFDLLKEIMESAIPLNVPVLADPEYGPDWGHVK